jgi:hypothetical protein
MAFRALRGVNVPPRGYLLVLRLGCRAIVSAATDGREEEREQPAGSREAVSPGWSDGGRKTSQLLRDLDLELGNRVAEDP